MSTFLSIRQRAFYFDRSDPNTKEEEQLPDNVRHPEVEDSGKKTLVPVFVDNITLRRTTRYEGFV